MDTKIIVQLINFFQNAKTTINLCIDSFTPVVSANVDWFKDADNAAKKRGVKLLYVTDITMENLSARKELMNVVSELRHIRGLAGNFGVSDSEYMSIPTVSKDMKPEQMRFVHSNSESVVKQQQMVFDTLWARAAHAYAQIDELEYEIEHKAKRTIDRIYICKDCNRSFAFLSEVEDHKNQTGHTNITEFPLGS